MVASAQAEVVGRRYLLQEQVGEGGMGVVYRATDRLTGENVALKRVTAGLQDLMDTRAILATRSLLSTQLASESHPSDSSDPRVSLAQEFETLASLRHPNIISVLDYGFDDQQQPYFTMSFVEHGQSFIDAVVGKPLETQISLLIQILQALAYLHRRGILHRDLKPANVVVTDGQVKVLDFGLALVRTRGVTETSDTTVGTFAYMAPELLSEQLPSPASDLYAVGIIAYEMLTGRHPFDTNNIVQLVSDTIHTMPDFTLTGITPPFVPVLGQLLAKDPADRYSDAHEVIVALSEAAKIPVPRESVAIRESFLQAAHFVGRKVELAQLIKSLSQMLKNSGSAWLVGGESGVGKSRLLDELRAVALVRGALVLRGQAISEAGVAYKVWRDPLRWLALVSELTEQEASVLKLLVPDIAVLLGHDVPDAPELDPQASQDRLLTVVENVFQRQTHPTVVILEDIHWANDSLDVLARLTRNLEGVPLLIIGTYRDDERPDLPKLLPKAKVLKLNRLPAQSIAELSESMLGEGGRDPGVVDLLVRETEGNVFFLVEIARVLAEEAGQLDNIANITLPKHVLAGGIRRILERRLNRVPEDARPLLNLSAVAGRQLDVLILKAAASSVDLDQWLNDCANVAVLDIQAGSWQFAHDKLRETLLNSLTVEERQDLHKKVALTIERVYRDAPEQAASLAYHWAAVGEDPKECHYTIIAGEQALRSGANKEAVRFLSRALVLDSQLSSAVISDETRLQRARWQRQLGEAYNSLGSLEKAREHFSEALRALGKPLPNSSALLTLALLVQVIRQTLHRLFPFAYVGRRQGHREVRLERSRIFDQVAIISYSSNDVVGTLHGAISLLNEAEGAGDSPELAIGYSGLAPVSGIVKLHSLARAYRSRALVVAAKANDPYATARVLQNTGLYNLGIGNWDDALQAFEESTLVFNKLGYSRRADESMGLGGNLNFYIGRFESSVERYYVAIANARQRGDIHLEILSLAAAGQNLLRLGRLPEALNFCREAVTLMHDSEHGGTQNPDNMNIYGPLAVTYLYMGQPEMAEEIAAKTIQIVRDAPIAVVYRCGSYWDITQVYMELCELSSEQGQERHAYMMQQAAIASAGLHKFAQVFPIAMPRDLLYSGVIDWLKGETNRAQQTWKKCLEEAIRRKMPYDEGLAHYQIGHRLENANPNRKAHLDRALEIFQELDAGADATRVQALQ